MDASIELVTPTYEHRAIYLIKTILSTIAAEIIIFRRLDNIYDLLFKIPFSKAINTAIKKKPPGGEVKIDIG